MFASLGLSAENLYLSWGKIEVFGEELEQSLVGCTFFSRCRDSDLEGLAKGADDAVAGGARHDLDGESAAASGLGDSQG